MNDYGKIVSVGEVAYERSERIDNPSISTIERFVGLEHFDSGDLAIVKYGDSKELGSTMKRCVAGDTLIARRNVYLKRASICNFDCLCSGDAIVLRENGEVAPGFLPILFNSDRFWKFASSNADGTMSKRLNVSHLKSYEFFLPLLNIQEKIVDLIWRIEKLKEELMNRVDILSEFIKSRFIEMFGTFDNPKYGLVEINQLVSKKVDKVAKTYGPDSIIHYIDISSINKDDRSIDSTNEYVVKGAPSRAQQCVIQGDILFSNVRPNLKTIARINSEKENLVCSSGFTVLRCEKCEPEYLITAIIDDIFTDILTNKATGSSYPAVTSKDVLEAPIPFGPKEVRKTFADFVKQVDKSKLVDSYYFNAIEGDERYV